MKERGKSLNKKLAAYSVAAAATLAIAPAAEALVVYSGPLNLPVDHNTTQNVDMDGGGTDFTFFGTLTYPVTFAYHYHNYISGAATGASFAATSGGRAANIASGYSVGSGISMWSSGTGVLNYLDRFFSSIINTSGNFVNSTGYIGVRFNTVCGQAYGWIQFSGTYTDGTIIDWAYEDICGAPILTGQTTGGVAHQVPTMGEWGMLALAGLLSAAAIKAINREEETA